MNSSRRVVSAWAAAVIAGLALALAGCSVTNPPDVLKVTDPGDGRSGQIGGPDANGGVLLRNFLVVSDGNGKPGTLVGAVKNQTGSPEDVTLTIVSTDQNGQQTPIGTTQVTVKPSEFVQFGDPAGGTGGTAAPTGAAVSPTPSSSPAESVGSGTTYTPTPPPSASNPSDVGSEPAIGRVTNYRIPAVQAAPGSVLQLVARTTDGGGTTIDLPILPPVGEYAYLAPAAASPTPTATSSPSGSASPSVDTSGAATQTATGSPSATP